jgi:hypothetical protein
MFKSLSEISRLFFALKFYQLNNNALLECRYQITVDPVFLWYSVTGEWSIFRLVNDYVMFFHHRSKRAPIDAGRDLQ